MAAPIDWNSKLGIEGRDGVGLREETKRSMTQGRQRKTGPFVNRGTSALQGRIWCCNDEGSERKSDPSPKH
jgi:hypothetical protein